MSEKPNPQWTIADVIALFKLGRNPETKIRISLYVIGIILTPITLGGALLGYVMAYTRKLYHMDLPPTLAPLHPFARLSMIVFAIGIWVCLIGGGIILVGALIVLGMNRDVGAHIIVFVAFMLLNALITIPIMVTFDKWRAKMFALRTELNRFGSSKWAENKDLDDLTGRGLYIGGGYTYSKMGHIMSIAGTRSGKFTNLIAPNLLGAGGYKGSWLVIDPKGETAFVSARFQRSIGQKVHIIDPWKVCGPDSSSYNPFDIIPLNDPETLADDATMMAYMLVPENPESREPYWDNSARSIITGLIIFAVLSEAKQKKDGKLGTYHNSSTTVRALSTVWRWLRLDEMEFADLASDMHKSGNEILRGCANEILMLKENTDNAFGSIMSTAHAHTDFLKSPALQRSLEKSSFNMNDLSDGKTTIYVVIPPDKLTSHGKWLGLVVSSALRSVIRNRNKRVTFVLDEFPSLGGAMREVKTFMAVGAGYNITLWPIFQTLNQLTELYQNSWQTFLGNAAVKHFWGIGDNFTATYVSEMIGKSTYVVYDKNIVGLEKAKPGERQLATEDEVRRGSANQIFTFIEQRPAALFPKWDYREMPALQGRHDPNPLYANISDEV